MFPSPRHGSSVRNAGSRESRASQVVRPGPSRSTMSLWSKLTGWWKWLSGPRTREVTRLSSVQGAPVDAAGRVADSVTEQVVEGGPLKEKHRRRVLRDPRLLPKKRPALGKRRKVMEAS